MLHVDQDVSAFMAQEHIQGLVHKPSTSKASKRKQNKRKCIKQKLARMENAKARVLLKLLPRVNKMTVWINKIVKEEGGFTRDSKVRY